MRRAGWILAVMLLVASTTLLLVRPPHRTQSPLTSRMAPASTGIDEDVDERAEMEFMIQRDPRANRIPPDIRRREQAFARTLPIRIRRGVGESAHGAEPLTWTERGPNNVGGRTRAFAIDVTSATTLIAGSVAGGIWKSTDDGASWSLRTAPAQLHGTTSIAQDRRGGKTNLWYVGTGEITGSTTNVTRWGALYRGDGIFKSTDNGDTWTLLPSTISGTPQISNSFDWVIDVATNPAAPANEDHVFAATYNGIHRSIDGGASWTQVVTSDSGWTDVAVTSGGVAYAFTKTGGAPRVSRSPDGVTWTNITPATFPSGSGRFILGLAPSNPNVLYCLGTAVNNAPQANGNQLWKYTYASGNGAGAGGTWENRGGNLPFELNTQGGYNMVVHVRPTDENFVIVGGTNLYRSTDGYTTTNTTAEVGGYAFYPDLGHHPDLHAGAYGPGTTYYSAGDGGVSKTDDITTNDGMVWTSLDNGYNVTQFYSVSIDPAAGSDLLLAGAQDNGSRLGDGPGASDWLLVFGGDGTVVKVAPPADDRLYTQYQNGQMQRQTRSYADLWDITPSGAANQLFVTPIILDPNVSQRLYYAAGISASSSRIWRNDSAPNANNTTGWSSLPATDVGAGAGYARRISALAMSTANATNVLYYGTNDGIVMRADNAHTAAPTVTNITPPGLNAGTASGGFVRSIAVDPTNSNVAIVAYGNYNFPSLRYTTNGGASWTDIEGNIAGASGPSVRWVQMFYVGTIPYVFLGTSIGVLSTNLVDGSSTVWAQEAATEIGNVLIAYMEYRASDRTLAVATFGRGVFTGTFSPNVGVEPPVAAVRATLEPSRPNPARRSATIAYELPRSGPATLRVYDVSGREVATLADGPHERGRHEVKFAGERLPAGTYYYTLRTADGVEARTLQLMR